MPPGTQFPRNQWYVAAYGSEITGELLARTICGQPHRLPAGITGAPAVPPPSFVP